jgi:anti-sigma B factor antagonist
MGFAPTFTARVDSQNGVASIALSGELDMATVPVLEDHLAHLEGDGVSTITLDLRGLTFLGSSALHAFLAARDRATTNGQRLILVGATSSARQLFGLTGTEFLLNDQDAAGVPDRFPIAQTLPMLDGPGVQLPVLDGAGPQLPVFGSA